MDHPLYRRGAKVKAKIFQFGHPVMNATIHDTSFALWYFMRVKLEDGSIVPAAFPPVEVID